MGLPTKRKGSSGTFRVVKSPAVAPRQLTCAPQEPYNFDKVSRFSQNYTAERKNA
jgi:hypothetical protein